MRYFYTKFSFFCLLLFHKMISMELCLIESLIIASSQLLLHAIDMFSATVVLVLGQVLSDSRLGENLCNVCFVALTCMHYLYILTV